MTRAKPTAAEFKKFWSIFEAKQQRKKNRTIPPSQFTKDQEPKQ
jgi:hypothetical protein